MTEPELRAARSGVDRKHQRPVAGRDGPLQEGRAYPSSAARVAARWRKEHGLKEPVPMPSATDEMVVGPDVEERVWAPSSSRVDRIITKLRRSGRQF